jgi:uncharacterized membrane protein YgcG
MKTFKPLILLLFILFASLSFADTQYPEKPKGYYVYDGVGIIRSDISNINRKLLDYEKQTSIEIAVVIVPFSYLGDEDVFTYSQNLFKKWGVGKKATNTGLLLLIARGDGKNEKKWRIHTGYGMEGIITDADAKKIGDQNIKPNFVNNDFVGGINKTLDALMNKMTFISPDERKKYEEEKKHKQELENIQSSANRSSVLMIIGVLIFLGAIGYFIYRFVQKKKEFYKNRKLFETLRKEANDEYNSYIYPYDNKIKDKQADIAYNSIKSDLTDLNSRKYKNEKDVKDAAEIKYHITSKFKKMVTDNAALYKFVKEDMDEYCFKEKQLHQENIKSATNFINQINQNYPKEVWKDFDYKNFSQIQLTKLVENDKMLTKCQDLLKQPSIDFSEIQSYVEAVRKSYGKLKADISFPEKLFYQLDNYKSQSSELLSKIENADKQFQSQIENTDDSNVRETWQRKRIELNQKYKKLSKDSKGSLINWIMLFSALSLLLSEYEDSSENLNQDIYNRNRRNDDDDRDSGLGVLGAAAAGLAIGSLFNGNDDNGSYSSGGDSNDNDFGGGDSGGGGSEGDW